MKEDKLGNLSMELSVEVLTWLKNCETKKKISYQIKSAEVPQVCANIAESKYSHSRADFISKLQISLKECYETEYWLELIHRTEILPDISPIIHSCGVIRKMLISSINTAKQNSETSK